MTSLSAEALISLILGIPSLILAVLTYSEARRARYEVSNAHLGNIFNPIVLFRDCWPNWSHRLKQRATMRLPLIRSLYLSVHRTRYQWSQCHSMPPATSFISRSMSSLLGTPGTRLLKKHSTSILLTRPGNDLLLWCARVWQAHINYINQVVISCILSMAGGKCLGLYR